MTVVLIVARTACLKSETDLCKTTRAADSDVDANRLRPAGTRERRKGGPELASHTMGLQDVPRNRRQTCRTLAPSTLSVRGQLADSEAVLPGPIPQDGGGE
jgi:hypothetical protein